MKWHPATTKRAVLEGHYGSAGHLDALKRLIERAITFCQQKEYNRVYLCTFEGLHAARHLYEKAGFRLVEQREGNQWGTWVNEQVFVLAAKEV